jgi:CheY-like chemotaxis protein
LTTKVLYVEHDDDNLYMLKTRLERCGDFEVLAAEDSEQGCKLAVTEHPDVILMGSRNASHGPLGTRADP